MRSARDVEKIVKIQSGLRVAKNSRKDNAIWLRVEFQHVRACKVFAKSTTEKLLRSSFCTAAAADDDGGWRARSTYGSRRDPAGSCCV